MRYYVGSVEGLALDGVLDVAQADRHVYDFVIMVEGFGAEEVVYGFSLVHETMRDGGSWGTYAELFRNWY